MNWQEFAAKIGLPSTGAMGDYYRPQIEEAMWNEARRQSLGFGSGFDLQGGNDMGGLVNATNQAAGRMPQSVTAQNMPANQYVQPSGPQMQNQQYMPAAPTNAAVSPGGQGNPTQNPYLPAMADDITRRASTQFMQQVNPAINRAAVANGGYGGSRQGIAQGLAMSQGMDNIAGQLSRLYANQFNADRNYGLANDAMDLNVYNANMGWMQQGQQNQLNTLDRLLGWNQQYGIGNSTNVQNTPLNYWQQFSQAAQGLGGMGGIGTNYLQGNPYLGALGGAMTAGNLWKSWGG